MQITYFYSYPNTYIFIEYPTQVGFSTEGSDNVAYEIQNTVAASFSTSGNVGFFIIQVFTQDIDDYAYIHIDLDYYKEGDEIGISDLKSQSGAGENTLCSAVIHGPAFTGQEYGYPADCEDFLDCSIQILHKSENTIAVYFYFEVMEGSNLAILEGLCVADACIVAESNVSTDGGTGLHQTGDNVKICYFCNGAGFTMCHTCGGDGYCQCPNCNGTGQYWSYAHDGFMTCSDVAGMERLLVQTVSVILEELPAATVMVLV